MNLNKGVNITEGQSASTIEGIATNKSAIIGNFLKGPVNVATLVTSMAEFERTFGTKPATGTTGYYSVAAFFAKNGSAPVWIVRIASATAAKSTLTIVDRQGIPASTLKVEAISEGAEGDYTSVQIADDNILSTIPSANIAIAATSASLQSIGGLEVGSWVELDNGTLQEQRQITGIDVANKQITWVTGLTNAYTTANGSVISQEFKILVYYKNNLVETWEGLSMVDDVTFHVEKAINDNSNYIVVTDLKASDAGFTDMPAVTAKTALASGADGLSDVTGSDYEGSASLGTGIYALDGVENLFYFCCPNPKLTDGDPAAAYKQLVQKMLDYADVPGSRVTMTVYADIPFGKTEAEAITWAAAFEGRRLVLWYPWGSINLSTGIEYIPASSGAMGAAVRKNNDRGVHKNIGNEALGYFTELEKQVSSANSELLNDAGVNTIELKNGSIRTWGGRTQSAETAWRFAHFSEYWNYLAATLTAGTQGIIFEPNDAGLRKRVTRILTNLLNNEKVIGAITDFAVVCDASTNLQDQVALGVLKATIAYVPVGTAEKFQIVLTSSPSGLVAA